MSAKTQVNVRLMRAERSVRSIDAIKAVARECGVSLMYAKGAVESAMRAEEVLLSADNPEQLLAELSSLGVHAELVKES